VVGTINARLKRREIRVLAGFGENVMECLRHKSASRDSAKSVS
jgi:hypothetical protein